MSHLRKQFNCRGSSPTGRRGKPVLPYALAVVLLLCGRDANAQSTLLRRQMNPKAAEHLERARRDYRNGELKAALSSVLAARKIDPYLVSTYQMEAQISHDLGDREGYLSALNAILDANPRSPQLQNAVGKLLVQAGKTDEGLMSLRRAVKLLPHNPQFAKDLAAAYVSGQHNERAVKVLSESVRLNPQDTSLPISLARLHEASGNWKQAVYCYDRVVRKDPENNFCLRQLARCRYQLGEYGESSKSYALCIKQQPKGLNLNDFVQYGDACLRTGNYKQAEKVFNFVSSRSSKPNKEIEVLRSVCALKRGSQGDAREIVLTALKHWPEDENLKIILTQCTQKNPSKTSKAGKNKTAAEKPGKVRITSNRKTETKKKQLPPPKKTAKSK